MRNCTKVRSKSCIAIQELAVPSNTTIIFMLKETISYNPKKKESTNSPIEQILQARTFPATVFEGIPAGFALVAC